MRALPYLCLRKHSTRCHRHASTNRLVRLVHSSSTFVQHIVHSLGEADLCTDRVDVLAIRKRAILWVAGVWLCGHNWYRQVLVAVSQLQCTLLDGTKTQLDLVADRKEIFEGLVQSWRRRLVRCGCSHSVVHCCCVIYIRSCHSHQVRQCVFQRPNQRFYFGHIVKLNLGCRRLAL